MQVERARLLFLLPAAAVGLGACHWIVGIDDRSEASQDASATEPGESDGGDGDVIATPDVAPLCEAGAHSCVGEQRRECKGDAWKDMGVCPAVCERGECIGPPSCALLQPDCGKAGKANCCAGRTVPAGSFKRSFDGIHDGYKDPQYTATISAFVLDVYEVTVGRFRAFVNAYQKPAEGSGKNASNPTDPGWPGASFSDMLPIDAGALKTALQCDAAATWTDGVGLNEYKPINCVTWLEAFAFCIYDGGRLPTEAEWNYAAAAGDEQRVYPWSQPAAPSEITADHAVYANAPLLAVGMKSPNGDGHWGHADLAGNVQEWTVDAWARPYSSTACIDCANVSLPPVVERTIRGGSFSDVSENLYTGARNYNQMTKRARNTGFRCARNSRP